MDFLGITADNPTFVDILTSIGNQYDLLEKIHEVTSTNKPIKEKEVQINDRTFQTFITPVRMQMNWTGKNSRGIHSSA